MPRDERSWYIVQQDTGHCEICPGEAVSDDGRSAANQKEHADDARKVWGPFLSEGEAIARRVGLIRAGKCKPYIG